MLEQNVKKKIRIKQKKTEQEKVCYDSFTEFFVMKQFVDNYRKKYEIFQVQSQNFVEKSQNLIFVFYSFTFFLCFHLNFC